MNNVCAIGRNFQVGSSSRCPVDRMHCAWMGCIHNLPLVDDMKFQHLVVVNDPFEPLLDVLTREQLWCGLVLRAGEPMRFIPWLDACTIVARSPDGMSRELQFGKLIVRDRVSWFAPTHIRYDTQPAADMPAASLTMRIEEPQPGMLLVRFEYDDGKADTLEPADEKYNDYLREAYRQTDIDTISLIRQLAEQNQLDVARGNASIH